MPCCTSSRPRTLLPLPLRLLWPACQRASARLVPRACLPTDCLPVCTHHCLSPPHSAPHQCHSFARTSGRVGAQHARCGLQSVAAWRRAGGCQGGWPRRQSSARAALAGSGWLCATQTVPNVPWIVASPPPLARRPAIALGTHAQVFELLPGMDSRAAWHEAALLRECIHDRIVPLYGVAIKARRGGAQLRPPKLPECSTMGGESSRRCCCWPAGRTGGRRAPRLPSTVHLCCCAVAEPQGLLLILVTRLMEGGSLTTALQIQEQREVLRWQAG